MLILVSTVDLWFEDSKVRKIAVLLIIVTAITDHKLIWAMITDVCYWDFDIVLSPSLFVEEGTDFNRGGCSCEEHITDTLHRETSIN